MTDLYLKALTKDDMDAKLLEAGVIDDEGVLAAGFSIDQIGPFTKFIGYDEAGVYYPDWHTNLRGEFTQAQLDLLTPLSVCPLLPYRVWA